MGGSGQGMLKVMVLVLKVPTLVCNPAGIKRQLLLEPWPLECRFTSIVKWCDSPSPGAVVLVPC